MLTAIFLIAILNLVILIKTIDLIQDIKKDIKLFYERMKPIMRHYSPKAKISIGGAMREIKFVATSCADCKLKNKYLECRLIDEDVELECDSFDFHKDCPMKEVGE